MKWPFVSRRAHEAVLADRERIRSERDQFKQDRDQFKRAAESVSEKYTDTCIANECLTEDLVKERQVSGSLALQIHATAQPVEPDLDAIDWPAKYEAEKKRADQLQRQYDQACGLNDSRVRDGRYWQQTRTDVARKPGADA